MTLFFEVSGPFQPIPGVHFARIHGGRTCRFWWLWFAVGIIPVDMAVYSEGVRTGRITWTQ